mmetsp:Transcript_31154/g.42214  ORF Transcript_31154/g.42214 Transcript_31154/m.42214 type:complete len:311 (-) Transcript_31154:316-1248(-)
MWRETKKRVDDEVNLPSISHSRVELCLTPEEQRRYQQAERLCVQSLRGMLRENREQRRHAAEEGLPNPPLVLPCQFPALFSTTRLRCCHSQLVIETELELASHLRINERDSNADNAASVYGSSSKLDALKKIILETLKKKPKAKFVVFSQWFSLLSHVQHILLGVLSSSSTSPPPVVLLRVGASGSNAVASFRENPACVVMCVCTRAGHGSAGLNLTCAQHAILLEPSLDVGMEAQAAGRVHRLGQTSEVTVHQLYMTGTIEDRIRTLQQRRRSLYEVNTDGLGELITDSDTYEMLEAFGLLAEAQSYSS